MTASGHLVLADGTVFSGTAVGAEGIATGEVVFNTSMTGYQEIATDPSYAGQIVAMTAPHIGNYGTNAADDQAERAWCTGFVTRAMSPIDSSWRSEGAFGGWLADRNIVGLTEVDTRRLTRHIRTHGAMPAAVGCGVALGDIESAAARAPSMAGQDLTRLVTTTKPYTVAASEDARGRVVAIDFGAKRDILTSLALRGLEVVVLPADTPAATVLSYEPSGVFLSNGPGDPEPVTAAVATVRDLLGQVPMFGICLGHQILGLAVGARTYKLPFGHHGGNHPVKRLSDGRVEITAQNHGFAVDLWSLADREPPSSEALPGPDLLPETVASDFGPVVPTHQNLNDGTLEGIAVPDAGAFSVQYHPEAAPGPQEASVLFDQFVTAMGVS